MAHYKTATSPMFNPSDMNQELHKRTKGVASLLLDNSSLRDALTDEQGQPVLDWGLAQLKAEARRTIDLPEEDVLPLLEKRAGTVSNLMRYFNRYVQTFSNPSAVEQLPGEVTWLEKVMIELESLAGGTLSLSSYEVLDSLQQQNDQLTPDSAFAQVMQIILKERPV